MNELKISTRISLGYLVITLAFLILAGVTVLQIQAVSVSADRMEHEARLMHLADVWQANVRQNSARALAVAYADGSSMLGFFQPSIKETTDQTNDVQKLFLDLARDADTRRNADAVIAVRTQWVKIRDQISDLKKGGNDTAARALVQDKLVAGTVDYVRTTQAMVDGQFEHVQSAHKMIEAGFQQLYFWGLLLLLACIAIAVFASWGLSRGIARGLAITRTAAEHIGAGDLSCTVPIQGSDELAEMAKVLVAMRQNLITVVSHVRQGSESVSTASAEIAQGNDDLSARTEHQASALEETAASMEDLHTTVRQNADSARHANQLAMDASTIAVQGGEVVSQVVVTMKGINESSRKISDIIIAPAL